ncbi:putative toxin-antitoxin system toxin component, PIN family [Candidatus Poriferisocius sp.]|uniref:putative toxin-antitoxin system toxin component, PIN family n=1 Tax=Candidatus Poriferisocius sp. TaxID=3101276 RepID=UPI003B59FF9B
MQVVLDANVYVSAAIAKGPSHRIVRAALTSQELDAIVCPTLIAEVQDVLGRPHLLKRIGAERVRSFVNDLRILALRVPDPSTNQAYTRDPSDDYLITLARQHDASYIVSGDKDLLEWAEQRPPVLTPAAFEELMNFPW